MNMILNSVAEPDPVLFGRSRCEGPAPVPVSGWTLDKTEEILKNILSVGSNIDQMLIKKLILRNKGIFFSRENGNILLNQKIRYFLGAGVRAGAVRKNFLDPVPVKKWTGSTTLLLK